MTLETNDRILIHELLARLDHAVDAQDWDGYLAFFDEAATMDPGFAPPVQGRDAIRNFLLHSEANTSGKRHVASNVFVEGTGNEAVANSYLTVIERQDVPKIVATAKIRDTLVKHDGSWMVDKHEVTIDPGMFKAFEAEQST